MKKHDKNGQLTSVICNCCGRKLVVIDGIAREGFLGIDHVWDYFSEKDGEVHYLDICEECYDALTGGFKIPVDIEEKAELL